ncbi:MAG TPA: hypothetical protein VF659_09465 [Pyrinomonadaceae bacterium]|jgi:hypothetical protein
MASKVTGLEVKYTDDDISTTPVPGATVEVRDVTDADPVTGAGAIRLDDIVADGSGVIPTTTLAGVAVGRLLRFTWKRESDGRSGTALRTTVAV